MLDVMTYWVGAVAGACAAAATAHSWTTDAQRYVEADAEIMAEGPGSDALAKLFAIREQAARKLAASPDPTGSEIRHHVASGIEPVRRYAVVAVIAKGRANVDVFRTMLESYQSIEDLYTRYYVARAFGRATPSQLDALSGPLVQAISSETVPFVLVAFTPLLTRMDVDGASRVIIGMLRSGDRGVQVAAYSQLLVLGSATMENVKAALHEAGDQLTLRAMAEIEASR
jgi:hypothetical protein